MADLCAAARHSVERQADLFRLAAARHDLSIRTLATLTGCSASTLKGWKDGAAMPAWALGKLRRAGVPDELLSLVLDPFNAAVTGADGDDGDIDALGIEAAGYVSEYVAAKADGVVTPIERDRLRERGRRVKATARRLAA